jgi:periplasmic protein CpxP/Spy
MNKFRFLTVSVVLLLLLNIGTLAYLFYTRKDTERPGPPGRAVADFIIQQLQLDAAQQEKFAQLRDRHQGILRSAHKADKDLHDIYFNLLKTDNPDTKRADSVSMLIADQRSLIEMATFVHFLELRKLCRDDQKKRFDATIDEVARRMGPKGPPGGPPRE